MFVLHLVAGSFGRSTVVRYNKMYCNQVQMHFIAEEKHMARTPASPMRASQDALKVLGNQIKLARHARGWTQADTARRVGVDPRTYSAIEKAWSMNRRRPI